MNSDGEVRTLRTHRPTRAAALLEEFQTQQSLEVLYALGVRRISAPLRGPERLEIGTVSGAPVPLPYATRAATGARWNALTKFARADTVPIPELPPQGAIAAPAQPRVAPMAGQRVLAFVGDELIANGTIGWNFMGRDGRYYFVSNWHVLCGYAKLDAEGKSRLRFALGDDSTPRGSRFPTIASLHHSWPAIPGGYNVLDLAVGRYDAGIVPAGRFRTTAGDENAPYPQDIMRVFHECDCFKVSASSGLRQGRLIGWATIAVDPPMGRKYWMTSQLELESPDGSTLALAGDSGSVWVDRQSVQVVGVHWGLSQEGRAYASPLAALGWTNRGMMSDGLPMLKYPPRAPSAATH